MEELRQSEKDKIEKENAVMKQWENVVDSIRQLRKDLLRPNMTEEESGEILEDIEALKAKKNNLALKLGFRGATL